MYTGDYYGLYEYGKFVSKKGVLGGTLPNNQSILSLDCMRNLQNIL